MQIDKFFHRSHEHDIIGKIKFDPRAQNFLVSLIPNNTTTAAVTASTAVTATTVKASTATAATTIKSPKSKGNLRNLKTKNL